MAVRKKNIVPSARGFQRRLTATKPAKKIVHTHMRASRTKKRPPHEVNRSRTEMCRMPFHSMGARTYFDASRFCQRPHFGVPDQLADYTAVRGVVRAEIDGPPTEGAAIIIFSWTPSVNRCFKITNLLEIHGNNYMCEFPFLAKHSMIAGPSMIHPLRQSVVMGNMSAAQDVQGFIRVLHLNLALALEYVNIQHVPERPGKARASHPKAGRDSMLAVINQHPRTRTITNSEMRTGVSIPILPGAMSQYKEYHQWSKHFAFRSRTCECVGFGVLVVGTGSGVLCLIEKRAAPTSRCIRRTFQVGGGGEVGGGERGVISQSGCHYLFMLKICRRRAATTMLCSTWCGWCGPDAASGNTPPCSKNRLCQKNLPQTTMMNKLCEHFRVRHTMFLS